MEIFALKFLINKKLEKRKRKKEQELKTNENMNEQTLWKINYAKKD